MKKSFLFTLLMLLCMISNSQNFTSCIDFPCMFGKNKYDALDYIRRYADNPTEDRNGHGSYIDATSNHNETFRWYFDAQGTINEFLVIFRNEYLNDYITDFDDYLTKNSVYHWSDNTSNPGLNIAINFERDHYYIDVTQKFGNNQISPRKIPRYDYFGFHMGGLSTDEINAATKNGTVSLLSHDDAKAKYTAPGQPLEGIPDSEFDKEYYSATLSYNQFRQGKFNGFMAEAFMYGDGPGQIQMKADAGAGLQTTRAGCDANGNRVNYGPEVDAAIAAEAQERARLLSYTYRWKNLLK